MLTNIRHFLYFPCLHLKSDMMFLLLRDNNGRGVQVCPHPVLTCQDIIPTPCQLSAFRWQPKCHGVAVFRLTTHFHLLPIQLHFLPYTSYEPHDRDEELFLVFLTIWASCLSPSQFVATWNIGWFQSGRQLSVISVKRFLWLRISLLMLSVNHTCSLF